MVWTHTPRVTFGCPRNLLNNVLKAGIKNELLVGKHKNEPTLPKNISRTCNLVNKAQQSYNGVALDVRF